MKKFIISMVLLTCFFTLSNCAKKISGCKDATATNFNAEATEDDGTCTYKPFQGPTFPGFEETGGWLQGSGNGYGGSGSGNRSNGTGFMPTKGSWYMNMSSIPSNNWYQSACSIYQENVDLSLSNTLIFDYAIGPVSGNTTVLATVDILFTVNGTITLWHKSFSNSAIVAVEKLNETVTLPSLPDKGKLTIKTYAEGGVGGITFNIDNIRVQ